MTVTTERKMDVTTSEETEKKEFIPSTEMVYYTYAGNFQMECDSKVLSCQFIDDKTVQVRLDKTVMHAQGGGQPTDTGTIVSLENNGNDKGSGNVINVTKVLIDRATGVATHTGSVESSSSSTTPDIRVGDSVHVTVDEDNRRLLSECHTAGHVVDSAMARNGTLLPPTKGYHFLDAPYVEYRGNIPAEDRPELIKKLQAAFQELVSEDIATQIQILPKQEAEDVCNRLAENFFNMSDYGEDTVRIVTVAGWPCPCGGTHVKSTGHLSERRWGITGLRCKKGVVRVKYGQNWDGGADGK